MRLWCYILIASILISVPLWLYPLNLMQASDSAGRAEIRDTSLSLIFFSFLCYRCSPDVKIAALLMLRLGGSHLLSRLAGWLLGNLQKGIGGLALSGDMCKPRKWRLF